MDHFDIEGHTDQQFPNSNQGQKSMEVKKVNEYNYDSSSKPKSNDSFDCFNCILNVVFKIIAIVLYLILKLITDSYLGTFISTVLLISMDFWVTKNLSARKLVGLRWWSQMTQNGDEEWVFQSRNPNRKPNGKNVVIFWISQLFFLVFWIIVFIINIFTISLFWIALALFAVVLAAINFVCFFKCRGEHQTKAKNLGKRLGIKNASQMF